MVISSVVQSSSGPLYIIYIALAILGMVGAGAVILAYFRGNLGRATIDALNQNNAALQQRVAILEQATSAKDALIHKLEGHVDALKDLVTQTSSIKDMNRDEKERHADLVQRLDQGFDRMIDALHEGPVRRPQPPLSRPRKVAAETDPGLPGQMRR